MSVHVPLNFLFFSLTLGDQLVDADRDQDAASSQSTLVKQKAASASEGEVMPQKRARNSAEIWKTCSFVHTQSVTKAGALQCLKR